MTENQPQIGTWDKLPTEDTDRKPRITFDVDVSVSVKFDFDSPLEFKGENGAYYIFEVTELSDNTKKVIMTSAWTLLKELKKLTPLKNKNVKITKRTVGNKQNFEVENLDSETF